MMTPTGIVQPEDAKYIKRRVKSGAIDVHPSEPALIVNYEVEAIILGESENPVLSDKKECQKIIRLKCLNKSSDCARLAREVVAKCSLIHPSKVGDVEHLIYFLQSRKENAFTGNFSDGMNSSASTNGYESPSGGVPNTSGERATYANLEQYVALLYEDLADKIKGSAYIMQLSLETDNLEELSRSDPVLSALARVLREDYKKSIDLSINILSIFHSFSCFTQFHSLILQYKIGSLSISIIEYELPLYAQWKSEIQFQRGRDTAPVSRLPVPKSARPGGQTPSGDRRRSSTPSAVGCQSADRKRLSLIPTPKTACSQRSPSTPDEESIQKKTLMIAKQDRLLKVNFMLLMNIAENLKVEDKIRKRNVVAMLVQCLDRNSVPLLITVAKFLTKLSIRVENKEEMANLNVIEKLPKLLQMNNYELEQATLQLLFNLSFDTNLRDKMIRVGFLQKLASLLNDERYTSVILKILYHLSMEDRVKAMFTFTNCLPKLMKMLISIDRNSEDFVNLVALSTNVALNQRCAETMCENGSLEHLKQRVLAYQDSLLMKVLRNLSLHESTKDAFLAFAEELLLVLPTCENEDYLLELTGTLGNLPLSELPNLSRIVSNNSFLLWIQQGLKPGREDDFVLELVMLIGSIAADEACSDLLCNANIISALIELLNRKQEDDEIVLQIIYTFYQVSRHPRSRAYLMKKTEAIDYLIDLMNDKNVNIRKVCDSCIDIIKEEDPDYEERVKMEKFQAHNAHWLAMVENKVLETSLSSLSDYREAMPHYDLNQSLMLNTGSHVSLANVDDIEIISNNPHSDEGSRPLSRYDSEGEDFSESFLIAKKKPFNNDDAVRNALRNLVIADDTSDTHQFYHIETPNTQVSMS
ncbi:kinesin-associated protein 3 isoform X2 [Cimex lectularius]|uniref:Kinesin-associated protein 3 n=1 Tax=Cimex lectularius TaxID=79782 RepID=A0A8I6RSI5_CIMLE|nr:kinesin-associated protein 3 isoform X2 [Cimex lectularius]